ncbi:MAG: hypothetical protein J0L94_02505 [Rhodothermia bacterium]|nr:hypothetical protein [Rhodothermia bacterium]
MKNKFLAIFFALSAFGCSEQSATTHNNRAAVKDASYSSAIPDKSIRPSLEQEKEMLRIRTEATPIMISNLSHEKVHEKLQSLLVRAQSLPDAYSFEQFVAMTMLDQRLLKSETLTPSELSILGFYTDLLLKWKNPDASLIQPALAKLSGTWSKEKLQEAENMAISSANEWMQKQGTPICKDCSSNEKNLDQSKLRQISSSLQIMKRAE